ncbi:MAG: [Fe-Fe] hydrogenase large subunit C-terminal domain-containing protein [Thermoguttaceae bacterium]
MSEFPISHRVFIESNTTNSNKNPTHILSRRALLGGGLGLIAGTAIAQQSETTSNQTSETSETSSVSPPTFMPTSMPTAPIVKRNTGKTHVKIDPNSFAIVRDRMSCNRCGECVEYCYRVNTIHGFRSSEGFESCTDCGQCTLHCHGNAITEKPQIAELMTALRDPNKVVVVSTSPAVRVAIGEMFELPSKNLEGQLVAALRKLGCDHVLDTTFGADLTIMEEAAEFVKRLDDTSANSPSNANATSQNGIVNGEKGAISYPMFTSCCPSWVRFAELFKPQLLPHISQVKSPILIQGGMIKTFFAKRKNIDPKQIVTVAVTPCTSKKMEVRREDQWTLKTIQGCENMREMDIVLTTRELGLMLSHFKIALPTLPPSEYDSIMGRGSGGGLDFGRTGGVLESAIRTAYFMKYGENPPQTVKQETVQGMEDVAWFEPIPFRRIAGVREANVAFKDRSVRAAIVETPGSLRGLLDAIENDGEVFDFVEVMNCRGGCLGGGGQPYSIGFPYILGCTTAMQNARKAAIKEGVDGSAVRLCHENPDIQLVYNEFLEKPLSTLATTLLHRKMI